MSSSTGNLRSTSSSSSSSTTTDTVPVSETQPLEPLEWPPAWATPSLTPICEEEENKQSEDVTPAPIETPKYSKPSSPPRMSEVIGDLKLLQSHSTKNTGRWYWQGHYSDGMEFFLWADYDAPPPRPFTRPDNIQYRKSNSAKNPGRYYWSGEWPNGRQYFEWADFKTARYTKYPTRRRAKK